MDQACTGTGGLSACSSGQGQLSERKVATSKILDPGPIGDLPLWYQFQKVGGALTPQRVSAILGDADIGWPAQFVDLVHELRQKDTELHQALQTRELGLAGLEWQCLDPESDPKRPKKGRRTRGQRIADDCTAMVQNIENLPELWAHLVGEGTLFSHAHSQIMWEKDGRRLYPARFKNVASRRFIFRLSDGALLFSDAWTTGDPADNGVDLCDEYPSKFIGYRPRVNGDVPVREGMGRVLTWAALFRNWTLRDWLLLAEIAWKPWRIGKYEKGASTEDIANLRSLLYRMSSTGEAVIPETVAIDIEWPKATGTMNTSPHKELADSMGAAMTKAILGQTLTSDQGQRGSQSLGNVHNQIRKDILEADSKGIARVFRQYVLKPYVEANYGANAPVPEFRFVTEDAADIVALSEAIKNLRDGGMKTIPESHVRDKFGIPEPEEGEPCLGDSAPVVPPGPGTPPQPGSPDPNQDPNADPAADPAQAA